MLSEKPDTIPRWKTCDNQAESNVIMRMRHCYTIVKNHMHAHTHTHTGVHVHKYKMVSGIIFPMWAPSISLN